ncbi:MAG TPA: response regulator transcription factor [Balneolaceae bacterium]|nr:response regulator transcription factor [Balneolaceae bacterium]
MTRYYSIKEYFHSFLKKSFPIQHSTNGLDVQMPAKSDGQPFTKRIKILIADDHKVIREGLRKIIEEDEDLIIAGEAANGDEAIKMARATNPDVIIMDVSMPIMNGIQTTRKISSEMPSIRIIGISLWGFTMTGKRMKRAGASAYLRKDKVFETLCTTIKEVAKEGLNIG